MGLGLSGARLSARAAGDILPESGSYRSLAAFSYRHGRTQQRRPRHPAFQLHPQTRDQRWRSYPAELWSDLANGNECAALRVMELLVKADAVSPVFSAMRATVLGLNMAGLAPLIAEIPKGNA